MTKAEQNPEREVDSPFTTRELLQRIDYLKRTLSSIANPRVPNTTGPLHSFTELDRDFLAHAASNALVHDEEVKEAKGWYGPELP